MNIVYPFFSSGQGTTEVLAEISWTESENATDLPAAPRAPATVLSLLDLGSDGLWIGGERRVPDLGVAQLAVDHVVEADKDLK